MKCLILLRTLLKKETDADAMDNDVDIVFSSLPTEFAAKVEKDFARDYVVASNALVLTG